MSGIENLADELADVWDDYDGYEEEEPSETGTSSVYDFDEALLPASPFKVDVRRTRDSGIDVSCSADSTPSKTRSPKGTTSRKPSTKLVSESPSQVLRERSRNSERFSHEGKEDDAWRVIEVLLSDIARLMPAEIASSEEALDNTLERVRTLGDQTGVEMQASRFACSQDALATRLIDHVKSLQPLTYATIVPLIQGVSESSYEEIHSLVVSTITTIPRPRASALPLLVQLNKISRDLVETLTHLSDSIHMSRQTADAATRRLKSVKELAAEMSRDVSAIEESRRWIETGDCQTKLASRESGAACQEVLSGFETLCNEWREKLFGSVEIAVA